MLGGYGEEKQPDTKIQELLNKHKSDIQSKLGIHFDNANVISYQTQVVAGTNYKIKAKTDQGNEFSVVIYEKLPHAGGETSVSEVQLQK